MARPANLTSGKAVADISEMYFLKHPNGVEPVILNELDSSDWFPVLTMKDSVEIDQADPNINKINVDQFDAAIGTTVDPGDFNFSAQLPEMRKAALLNWLGEDDVEETGKSINGRKLIGLNLDGKLYDVSVLIVTDTNDSILLTHVQVSLSFTKQDKVFMFKINGQVLAASNPANKMFYVAHDQADAPTSISLNKSTTSIAVEGTETLTATVSPSGADDRVIWSSSDSTKATVDQDGKVTGVATASGASAPKIRATSVADSTKYAECTVTVTAS